MKGNKITRFSADVELIEWDAMDPAGLDSDVPVHRGHLYYNDEDLSLMSGVWDCTPFIRKMRPYNVNEFIYILEGSVTIELEDGSSATISAGESFLIPKGLVCRWVQSEYVRKFFVIFSGAENVAHKDPTQFGIMAPKPSDAVTPVVIKDRSKIMGALPEQQHHIYYTDVTGQFTVSMWHSDAFERPVMEFDHFELMCILEGEATVSDGAGNDQVIESGDAVFVPQGAQYKWKSDVPVTKVYCAFSPNV